MAFLEENCVLNILTDDILEECHPFVCGDDDMGMWFLDDSNKTGCRFAIVDAKNEPNILQFYERNGFKTLFPREIDEDLYTKPPKDEEERLERTKHPRKLKTRLMFSDLLDE